MMDIPVVNIDSQRIADFCRRWELRELSIFGSAVRGGMNADSDVDILITLRADHYPDIDEWDSMRHELADIFGRRVDLISNRGIENPFVRHHILQNREVLYAA